MAKEILAAPAPSVEDAQESAIITEVKIDPGPGFPYVPLARHGQPKPEPVEGPREITTVKTNQDHFRGFLDRIANISAPKGGMK